MSALYETSPVGPRQRKFINAVVAVSTSGAPSDALLELKRIERALGRKPAVRRWGPRPIDIDILLWGNRVVRRPALAIPHREMIHRRFVLEPLAEIAPRRVHPSEHKTMKRLRDELRARCPEQKVNIFDVSPRPVGERARVRGI